MKGYASLTTGKAHSLEKAGWYYAQETGRQTDANVNIPLKMLLGFFEDYNKIVVSAKYELILRRETQTTTPSYKLKQKNSRFLSSEWNGSRHRSYQDTASQSHQSRQDSDAPFPHMGSV